MKVFLLFLKLLCIEKLTIIFLPEFVPYLNKVISADGTFSCVKNIPGVYQVYIISTKLYSTDKSRTRLQPLMLIFLFNKKTETYSKIWSEIKEIFHEITGENLSPERLHIDNGSAVISSVDEHFPNTSIITCLSHLKSNFLKKIDQIGLKNRSKELDALFTTLNGLLFLDLKCDFQYNMAINFFDSILNDLEFLVTNELERVKFTKFLTYFRVNYLNKNHKFF